MGNLQHLDTANAVCLGIGSLIVVYAGLTVTNINVCNIPNLAHPVCIWTLYFDEVYSDLPFLQRNVTLFTWQTVQAVQQYNWISEWPILQSKDRTVSACPWIIVYNLNLKSYHISNQHFYQILLESGHKISMLEIIIVSFLSALHAEAGEIWFAIHFPEIPVRRAFVSLCLHKRWPSSSMYFRQTWWMRFSLTAASSCCVTKLVAWSTATRVLWGHGQVPIQSLLRGATRGWLVLKLSRLGPSKHVVLYKAKYLPF